jgi:hypothetical protein
MTNKNDNLKEKEINEEKTIEQDKLENVSGGWGDFWGRGKDYTINSDICQEKECQQASCASSCCHPGAVKAYSDYGNGKRWE